MSEKVYCIECINYKTIEVTKDGFSFDEECKSSKNCKEKDFRGFIKIYTPREKNVSMNCDWFERRR